MKGLNNTQNGWNEYSKLVLAELERLEDDNKEMQKTLTAINIKLEKALTKAEDFEAIKKDVVKLNVFRTVAITVWGVVQALFFVFISLFKS